MTFVDVIVVAAFVFVFCLIAFQSFRDKVKEIIGKLKDKL